MKSDSRTAVLAFAAALIMACGSVACSRTPQADPGESSDVSRAESRGEHVAGEGGETGEHEGEEGADHEEGGEGEEGEEGGPHIQRGEKYDTIRRGARLVLTFDAVSNAFRGMVENTTESTLCAVRVEVHLSSGTELGPTEPKDLPAGESTGVELPTGGEPFDTWTAHPEVSRCSSE